MKKLTMLVAVVLVFAISSFAETMWRPTLYLGGGASVPTGNFKDGFKTGFNLGGAYGMQYRSTYEILGEVFYSRFPLDQGKFLATLPGGTTITGGASKILSIDAALRYYMPVGHGTSKIKPYLLGRAGVAHLTQSDLTLARNSISSTTSFPGTSKFTYGFGAGTTFDMNPNLALWVEGKFTGVSTKIHNTDYVPIQAGIKYTFGKY